MVSTLGCATVGPLVKFNPKSAATIASVIRASETNALPSVFRFIVCRFACSLTFRTPFPLLRYRRSSARFRRFERLAVDFVHPEPEVKRPRVLCGFRRAGQCRQMSEMLWSLSRPVTCILLRVVTLMPSRLAINR